MTFEIEDGKLVFKTKLSEGESYQVVVYPKFNIEAKIKNFRIKLLIQI